MNLSIGGTPATAEQLENLRTAMGVPAKAQLLDALGLGTKAAVFLKDGQFVDREGATLEAAPAFLPAVNLNGLAVVTVGGQAYAMLPVDESGDIQANVAHRKGNLADLLLIDGGDGEIGVAADAHALVLYNGVPGEARVIKRIDNPTALGDNSFAIGLDASTPADAAHSLALSTNAKPQGPGQHVFGSAYEPAQHIELIVSAATTDDTGIYLTPLGAEHSFGSNSIKLTRSGIYDVELVLLARQSGSNNWARFKRNFMVRRSSTSMVITDITTPTPDINSNLAGLTFETADIAGYGPTSAGGYLLLNVRGLPGVTIRWAGFLTIRQLGYQT